MLSDHDLLEILRAQILSKCGIGAISSRDCKQISEMIFEQDKNYLSETTIKRFFGILDWDQPFSPFVLNSLCNFTDFQTYEAFREHYLHSA